MKIWIYFKSSSNSIKDWRSLQIERCFLFSILLFNYLRLWYWLHLIYFSCSSHYLSYLPLSFLLHQENSGLLPIQIHMWAFSDRLSLGFLRGHYFHFIVSSKASFRFGYFFKWFLGFLGRRPTNWQSAQWTEWRIALSFWGNVSTSLPKVNSLEH